MKYLNVSEIKPDKDQPRRTFNEEKMDALEASMRTDGFRKEYPILINGGNIIIDGERRWRIAKKIGLNTVPVEVREHVEPHERLMYQLQSEGAELEPIEKYKAWVKLWSLAKMFETKRSLAKRLGVSENSFSGVLDQYQKYTGVLKVLGPKTRTQILPNKYHMLSEIGREEDTSLRKELAEKAIKEDWQEKKAREIRRAIKERPIRTKQILSQDYSDPHEGSSQWKMRLEVAKSDVDIEELKDMDNFRQEMQGNVDAVTSVLEYGLKMAAAMRRVTYQSFTQEAVIKYHQTLLKFVPFASRHIKDVEDYLIDKGWGDRNLKELQ